MTENGDRPARTGWAVITALAIVVLFVAAALPFAIWQFTSNSDEPRYTVAAARMMATGDYLIPEAAWGEARLLKPPLTYYYIVAGFALFGQSVIGAKALWLVTSAAILGLTWALARALGATRWGGAVAVAALAGNILWFRSTLIHNPDIPMVLGMTLALFGAVRVLGRRPPPLWAIFAIWLGLAWAFLAKGLLALVLAGLIVAARWAAFGRAWPRSGELFAVALSAILAFWWHATVAIIEPAALWEQFVGDQVTGKADFVLSRVFVGLGYDAFFLLLGFIPFLLAGLPWRPRLGKRPSAAVLFLWSWIATVVVIFAFSNYLSERYMLPAMPAFAALLGLGLGRLNPQRLARRAGRAVRLLLPVSLAVGLLSVGILYAGTSLMVAAVALVSVLLLLWAVWRLSGRGRPGLSLTLLALFAPATILLAMPGYLVLAWPTAADLAVREVRASGLTPSDITILQRWHLLERVGLREGPIEEYRFFEQIDDPGFDPGAMTLAVRERAGQALYDSGLDVRRLAGAPEGFALGDLLEAIAARDLASLREKFGEPLFIARPAGSDALPLAMDQPQVPAVDEDAEGLPEDEDGVGAVDGVGEQDDAAAEGEIPEGEGDR